MFGHGLIVTLLRFQGVEFVEKAGFVGCDPLLNRVVEPECGLEIEQMLLAPIPGEVTHRAMDLNIHLIQRLLHPLDEARTLTPPPPRFAICRCSARSRVMDSCGRNDPRNKPQLWSS